MRTWTWGAEGARRVACCGGTSAQVDRAEASGGFAGPHDACILCPLSGFVSAHIAHHGTSSVVERERAAAPHGCASVVLSALCLSLKPYSYSYS